MKQVQEITNIDNMHTNGQKLHYLELADGTIYTDIDTDDIELMRKQIPRRLKLKLESDGYDVLPFDLWLILSVVCERSDIGLNADWAVSTFNLCNDIYCCDNEYHNGVTFGTRAVDDDGICHDTAIATFTEDQLADAIQFIKLIQDHQ